MNPSATDDNDAGGDEMVIFNSNYDLDGTLEIIPVQSLFSGCTGIVSQYMRRNQLLYMVTEIEKPRSRMLRIALACWTGSFLCASS